MRSIPALASLASFAFAAAAGAGTLQFTDATSAAHVSVTHATSGFSHYDYTGGGCVGDFDRDGDQDLFVISGGNGNVPDHLFINNGNGVFSDQAAAWGLTTIHRGKGATVGDYNNDGWLDIFVTSAGPLGGAAPGHHKLYRNNGNGTFTNVAAGAGVNFTTTTVEDGFGSCFADYDLDGDLDLFVAGFASGNSGSKLFRNNGDGTFTDVTAASQFFDATPQNMAAFTPLFIDNNGDFYPDVILVADFNTSRYFKNDTDGTFTDWTNVSHLGQEENGMGGCTGDFNNDGLLDSYATSIYFPGAGWTGNKLYYNQGNHLFLESTAAAGCVDGGYGWGTLAVDFDHDGRLDIVETNGSNNGTTFNNEQSYLWIQQPDGTFDESAVSMGLVHNLQGRGIVQLDMEGDGDQDLVFFSNNDPLRLFRNDLSGADIAWLRVFLDTAGTPGLAPDGIGARVYTVVDGMQRMRVIGGGSGFESHSELSAHFGLADATIIDEVRVEWPDGTITTLNDVAVNQTITISLAEGPCVPADINDDGAIDVTDLVTLILAWGTADPAADLDGSGVVDVADLVELILAWGPCPGA